jgi:hypothetical protein
MMLAVTRLLACLAIFLLWLAPGPVLSALTLDARIAAIRPTADEDRWLQIPWRSDLLQARQEADQAGKPLFMWLMDGDPLGCT